MDRLRAADERGRHDRRDVQIGIARRRRPDADRLIGQMHRQAVRVRFAVHEHGLDAELAAGADDTKRYLATVGDKDLIEGQEAPPPKSSRRTRWPSARL